MQNEEQTRELLCRLGALRTGHFLRAGGRHTGVYAQCAALFEDPQAAQTVCAQLAERFRESDVQLVLSAAVGGLLAGYETARQLGVRMIYAERRDNALTLRRGFTIAPGTRVLIVEDTVATGRSVCELMEIVRALEGVVAGVACVLDTSVAPVDFGAPYFALCRQKAPYYAPERCPLCREGLPLDKG